jgi:myo-inositol 2-dehydrogenase/D-chiro-inositol 1-dehydrogenase
VRATLRFRNGAVGGLDGGHNTPLDGGTSRVAVGSLGMAVFEGRRELRVRMLGERASRVVDVAHPPDPALGDGSKLAEDEEFLQAIEAGRKPEVTGEDGRASLALCLAVHESSRERRAVRAL